MTNDDSLLLNINTVRALDNILRHYNIEEKQALREEIIEWAQTAINDSRNDWVQMRQNSIQALLKYEKKETARKNARKRDEKYAAFRTYFYQMQQQKFLETLKNGKILSASGFAVWFLAQKTHEIPIPYLKQNQKNKLTQLAIANNREFKKAFAFKG